ncbi:TIGR02391 family protein [Robbsia sp. Bb-Pol-6]|uniref:TIGR02391 family protein n=1 Tax=Robbsia betulipollinis TaxID=2981849 RepID=A0ABT3ZPE8_9BURK|nr:TIGR02391 family protein [Robbsia betulipollinis]MCY0388405.1 TIGR02391 family protein [Robbsia betulipollinis]
MRELPEAIPDPEVLIALEAEELAATLIFLIQKRVEADTRAGAGHAGTFHPATFINEFWDTNIPTNGRPTYPRTHQPLIDMAVIEAVAWLEAQGLIVPSDATNGHMGWRRLSRRAQKFENQAQFADYRTARLLPKELLHPSIATTVWLSFMRCEYSTAVFQAMRAVEIAVRDAAHLPHSDVGVNLVRKAFHATTGALTDLSAEGGEKEAMSALFSGAIGTYKNPHSHRDVSVDTPREAVEIILLASHLLYVVDARVVTRVAT